MKKVRVKFLNFYQARNGFIYANLDHDLFFQMTLEQVHHVCHGASSPSMMGIESEDYDQAAFNRAYELYQKETT